MSRVMLNVVSVTRKEQFRSYKANPATRGFDRGNPPDLFRISIGKFRISNSYFLFWNDFKVIYYNS